MLTYEYNVLNPDFDTLGYIVAVANLKDKHDRSAPSDYHWKILKCRMIIFSNSSVLASPDKNDLKEIHIIFNKIGDCYDKLTSLFLKFSLIQDGSLRKITPEVYRMCFHYTLTARLAPSWNTLGCDNLINNRDFLTTKGPQNGITYFVKSSNEVTAIQLRPVKIHIMRSDEDFQPGEWIRVMPSLNKAVVEGCFHSLPSSGSFKSYKDLRRHWKNIHGYRLPEEEDSYCVVQFWRGEPLTYPRLCVTRHFPIITPMPISEETAVITSFINCLRSKMSNVLGRQISIQRVSNLVPSHDAGVRTIPETQAVSLCTPTQP